VIRITWAAQNQVEDLVRFYVVEKDRPDAARRLSEDLANAARSIQNNPEGGNLFPRPYPTLEWLAFRWLKSRIYWVSWRVMDGVPVVTNVLHASADLERRATGDIEGLRDW
jgi:plasmid stabilization system protein ParE